MAIYQQQVIEEGTEEDFKACLLRAYADFIASSWCHACHHATDHTYRCHQQAWNVKCNRCGSFHAVALATWEPAYFQSRPWRAAS